MDNKLIQTDKEEYKIATFDFEAHPLTVNKAWQGRRFKSKDYEVYEKELWVLLPHSSVGGVCFKGEVKIRYTFYLKYYATTDVSNLIKCLEDIMVKRGIIEDDKLVVSFSATKIKAEKDKIEISIWQNKLK